VAVGWGIKKIKHLRESNSGIPGEDKRNIKSEFKKDAALAKTTDDARH